MDAGAHAERRRAGTFLDVIAVEPLRALTQIDEETGDCIMATIVTIIQIVLALGFAVGGVLRLTRPYATYTQLPGQAWANDFKPGHIRLIGALEVCAAVGLLVPLFLHSLTTLTTLAALGVALILSGAMVTHLRRLEYWNMIGNLLVFLVPALFVAYGTLVGFAV
jgi:DoxX-like family